MAINTLDVSQNMELPSEGVEVYHDTLEAGMTETDFITSVNSQMDRAKRYWDKLKIDKRRETNFKYWFGDQVDKGGLRDDLEKWAENDIFRNIETYMPIANSRTPELTVTPGFKNEQTRAFAADVKRLLQTEWEVTQEMQPLLGRGIRNHAINLIGVYQYGRDPDIGLNWVEEIYATDVVISKDGKFIARYIRDKTLGDLLDMFPEDEQKITKEVTGAININKTKEILDSPVEYLEIWSGNLVGWKLNNVMLGKVQKNPHFDYVGRELDIPTGMAKADPVTGEMVEVTEKKKVFYNFFPEPRPPFLFLTYWNRGVHLIDDTTILEQGIGVQDWINKRKRQIGANADSTNGHWVSSGDYISQEEFDKIEGGVDEKIWLENGMPKDGLAKVTGMPLPDYIYNDLIDSRAALDNIMSTHNTTRGESAGNKTLGQDLLQKDQDYGRIDGYVRDCIERFAKQWFEAMYHMYLVYQEEETSIAVPEDDDVESENVLFSRERVPLVTLKNGELKVVPLVLRVKQGSTLPKDEVAEYAKAKDMKDMLRPLDYFKKTGEANPRQLEKNFLIWQLDPLSQYADDPDIQKALQARQAADAAKNQQAMEAEAAKAKMGTDSKIAVAKATKPPVSGEAAGTGGAEGEPSVTGVANALMAEMQEAAA